MRISVEPVMIEPLHRLDKGIRKNTLRLQYDSLSDLADAVERDSEAASRYASGRKLESALGMARLGWMDQLDVALSVAEDAITKVEREHTVTTFARRLDVVGKRADIGRFMSGQPHCMVRLQPVAVPRTGKVITMCASISYSAGLSEETVIKRGRNIAALAIALDKLGYATELYTDFTGAVDKHTGFSVRTMVKSAHDVADPATILYAYAHPTSARVLTFAQCEAANQRPEHSKYISAGLGPVSKAVEDLPEGTLYLPPIVSRYDVPDADKFLLEHMRTLGLISD